MGLYLSNMKPSFLNRTILSDVYFKTSTELENDYDSFSPFPSMKSRFEGNMRGILKSLDTGAEFIKKYDSGVYDGLGDFDIRKGLECRGDDIGKYSYKRLEDVQIEDIERFIDQVTLSLRVRKANVDLIPTKKDVQLPIVDEESGHCIVESELECIRDEDVFELDMDCREAAVKIPYLVKSLHEGSIKLGLNILSVMVFMRNHYYSVNPGKWCGVFGNAGPRKYLGFGPSYPNNEYAIYRTNRNGDILGFYDKDAWSRNVEMQDYFWGLIGLNGASNGYYDPSLGWDPEKDPDNLNSYFKMGIELISCCDRLGVTFGGKDIVKCYEPKFVNSLAVKYVQSNRDSIDFLLSKLYNSSNELSITQNELEKFNIFKNRVASISSYSKQTSSTDSSTLHLNSRFDEAEVATNIIYNYYEELIVEDQFKQDLKLEDDYLQLIYTLRERAELLESINRRIDAGQYRDFLFMADDGNPRERNNIIYGKNGLPLFIRIVELVDVFKSRLKRKYKGVQMMLNIIEESNALFITNTGKVVLLTNFYDRPMYMTIPDFIREIEYLSISDI